MGVYMGVSWVQTPQMLTLAHVELWPKTHENAHTLTGSTPEIEPPSQKFFSCRVPE